MKGDSMQQPEIHDPELLAYATRIAAKVLKLSLVAAEAMEMVVDRYVVGQERYGEPDLDGRDWVRELEEEIVDQRAYEPLLLAAHRRRQRRLRITRVEPPMVAISFDTSDCELVSPMDDEPTLERVITAYTERQP